MIPLRVNDLKQYAYCPRVVFYHYVMPVEALSTYKMEHGKLAEEKIDELERRRGLKRYGLDSGTRRFHQYIHSDSLGLSGRADLLIETEASIYPVDFKFTFDEVRENHRCQLCGYALMLEEKFRKPVSVGFIYLIPQNDAIEVEMTPELRQTTLTILSEIREMLRNERMPDPTPFQARCTDCEYRNYCGDVF